MTPPVRAESARGHVTKALLWGSRRGAEDAGRSGPPGTPAGDARRNRFRLPSSRVQGALARASRFVPRRRSAGEPAASIRLAQRRRVRQGETTGAWDRPRPSPAGETQERRPDLRSSRRGDLTVSPVADAQRARRRRRSSPRQRHGPQIDADGRRSRPIRRRPRASGCVVIGSKSTGGPQITPRTSQILARAPPRPTRVAPSIVSSAFICAIRGLHQSGPSRGPAGVDPRHQHPHGHRRSRQMGADPHRPHGDNAPERLRRSFCDICVSSAGPLPGSTPCAGGACRAFARASSSAPTPRHNGTPA
jgi:hypothetical protein